MRSLRPNQPARGFSILEVMISVTLVGLCASLAVPTFSKIRSHSQDAAILSNARQIASAANRYFLENGAETVSLSQLLTDPAYLNRLVAIAGESYPEQITSGQPVVVSNISGSRTLSFDL